MAIKKIGSQWRLDFRIGEKRYQHTAKTKIECIEYRDQKIATKSKQQPDKDNRRLSESNYLVIPFDFPSYQGL